MCGAAVGTLKNLFPTWKNSQLADCEPRKGARGQEMPHRFARGHAPLPSRRARCCERLLFKAPAGFGEPPFPLAHRAARSTGGASRRHLQNKLMSRSMGRFSIGRKSCIVAGRVAKEYPPWPPGGRRERLRHLPFREVPQISPFFAEDKE